MNSLLNPLLNRKMPGLLHSTIFCIFICGANTKAVQERAMVNYFDPNYVKEAQAFTYRARRGDPYRSNITATILHPWGNNVTFTLLYANKRFGSDRLAEFRACDFLKLKWIEDFVWAYLKTKTCPFPARSYSIYNLELPPKNYPLPVPKGEGQVIGYFSLTSNKHLLLKYSLKLKT